MSTLASQLSSLRDDRNKNLKHFLSQYKSNVQWNYIEVFKSWNYLLSLNNQFQTCESLFSQINYGSNHISSENDNDSMDLEGSNTLFNEQKDLEFLTSHELEELNTKVRTFIELSVPYFMNEESHHLIDYLIFKYNIAVSFSEFLLVSYLQYNDSEYYCKLLSLVTLSNDSCFYYLYNELKSVSLNFTEHKYISSTLVLSAIAKNFSLYKEISTCYNKLAQTCKINTKIVSFLNTLNFHYIIVNCKVMDNNEIRYVINMVKEGLSNVDNLEYLSSQICTLITLFTQLQLAVVAQRELICSLKPILHIINGLDRIKIDYLVIYKYIVLSVHLMFQYQKQTLDKIPQDIAKLMIDILQKHDSLQIVFNNLKLLKETDFSRFFNVFLHSLVSLNISKFDPQSRLTMEKRDKYGLNDLYFLLDFVNKTFGSRYLKLILFYMIDELIRISTHVKQFNESIISFDETNVSVTINTTLKFSSHLILLGHLFKIAKQVNSTVLEAAMMEYLNKLSYDLIEEHLDVILFMYRSISEDITYRLLILLNKYSESKYELNDKKKHIGNMMKLFSSLNDQRSDGLKNENIYNSMVDFITSMYSKTDSNIIDLNQFLFNFIANSLTNEALFAKLESDQLLWKSIPINISFDVLVKHIQITIDKLDSEFIYNDPIKLGTFGSQINAKNEFKSIFSSYIRHLTSHKSMVDLIFRINNIIERIHNEYSMIQSSSSHISLKEFIRFLSLLYHNESHSVHNDRVTTSNMIELNNETINILSNLLLTTTGTKPDKLDNTDDSYSYNGYIGSNTHIFNSFSILFRQFENIQFLTKYDDDIELSHSQFVLINDILIKCALNNLFSKNISKFIIDFYKLIINRFEYDLYDKRNKFNRTFVIKRMEIILNNKELSLYYINCLSVSSNKDTDLSTATDEQKTTINDSSHKYLDYISDTFELLTIMKIRDFNANFRVNYHHDNNDKLTMNLHVPLKYRYRLLNLDYLKFTRDTHLSHILSNRISNPFLDDLDNINEYSSIVLFDSISDDITDKAIHLILSSFKHCIGEEWCPQLYLDLLIKSLCFVCDASKYSNKFASLVFDLTKMCNKTNLNQNVINKPLEYFNVQNKTKLASYKVNFKYDLKTLVDTILISNKTLNQTTDQLASVISSHLKKDKEFYNLFMVNLFSESNCIYNFTYVEMMIVMISDSKHDMNGLFSVLKQMLERLYAISCDGKMDRVIYVSQFLDVFYRYSLLLYALSKRISSSKSQMVDRYVSIWSHIFRLCTLFKLATNTNNKPSNASLNLSPDNLKMVNVVSHELDYLKLVNHSVGLFDYFPFMCLYNIKNGFIWSLSPSVRNQFYSTFVLFYRDSNDIYLNTLIKRMFEFHDIDDNSLLPFVEYALNNSFMEEVITFIINNIDSMKTYELLIYMIQLNKLSLSLNVNLITKILNNFSVSTDFESKKVRMFLFTNSNKLISAFTNVLCNANSHDAFENSFDSDLDAELKSILTKNSGRATNDNLVNNKLVTEVGNRINNLENDSSFNTKSTNNAGVLDNDEIISILSIIVNHSNCLFNNIHSMEAKKSNTFNKLYNEFYHNICYLIKCSLNRFGFALYKLFKSLINNLISSTIKVTVIHSDKLLDECVKNTVISTTNNIISLDINGLTELILMLIDRENIKSMGDETYLAWTSYLIYVYFRISHKNKIDNESDDICSKYTKIVEFLNCYECVPILSNILWIHQSISFNPVNKHGIKTSCFVGYGLTDAMLDDDNNNNRSRIDYQLSNELYGFVLAYLSNNNKCTLNIDTTMFYDKTSENQKQFLSVNGLIYSLVSSIVLIKHYNEDDPTNSTKKNENGNIVLSSDYSNLINTISTTIGYIFRNNQLGGFNIHVFGTVDKIFNHQLMDLVSSFDSDENVWEKLESNALNFQYHLHTVRTLMSLANKFNTPMKLKDNPLRLKYEKELEQIHNTSSKALFDFFDYSTDKYIDSMDDDLFNDISYMRASVWEYFINSPTFSCDPFIHIIENSFSLILDHHVSRRTLLWSYLDLVCGLKLIIKIGSISSGFSSTDPYLINVDSKFLSETSKVNSAINKFRKVAQILLLGGAKIGSFLHTLFILFSLCTHKYFSSFLNNDFYEFSIKLILKYKSESNSLNGLMIDLGNDGSLNQCFDEFVNVTIDDCIKAITDSSVTNFKYLNRELLMTYTTYYTSIRMEIKYLIKFISNECTKFDGSNESVQINSDVLYQLSRLLTCLSYNIYNKKPKSKYIDDLNNVYFIIVNFYSMYSFKLLFGNSEALSFAEFNKSHTKIDETILASNKLNTILFINNASMESVTIFERSFVSYVLKFFSLISSNKLLDLLEKHFKISSVSKEVVSTDKRNLMMQSDLKYRMLFIVVLSSLYEYGNLGTTNLIMTRLYQNIEDIAEYSVSEALLNLKSVEKQLSFDSTWTWFINCRFMLQLIQKSIDTWNVQRGVVPDAIVNSWVKTIKRFINLFDLFPINAELEVDNITTAWSNTLESTLRSLVNGFITQDDKIIKIESCLSDQLPTKSLNVKIGCLVIMNKLWDDLGMHLSLSIKNIMPIIGELVDDENEIVRRLSLKLDEKVKEVLYQN